MRFVLALLFVGVFAVVRPASKNLVTLTEATWTDLLKGEWMVEFHAPWCPACKDLQKAWNSFADAGKEMNLKVAEVDVTVNPGLSGRFLVTALPTIYHVKEGVFRVYSGPRDKNDFIAYVEDKKWSLTEPVPAYKHPNSPQMAVVAVLFKLSMSVRDLHNYLVEEVGIPSWASYSLFAGVTLGLGCILGFLIVCVIDHVFPTAGRAETVSAKADKGRGKKDSKKAKKEEQKKKDDEKAAHSQDEKSSQEDESGDENVRHRKNADKKETPKASPTNEGKKKK